MRGVCVKNSRLLLAIVLIIALAIIFVPTVVRRVILRRLQSMVSAQLNAELQVGDLSYRFPYGVDVADAALTATGPDGKSFELLHVSRLSLELARSPLSSGPLIIESLNIQNPTIHLIRLPAGLAGRVGLAKSETQKQEEQQPWKVSDMFRLRQVAISDGKIIYENRTLAGTRPLVWSNLNLDLRIAPQSGSDYGFHIVANDTPLASMDATGSADIDSFLLKLDQLKLAVNVNPAERESAVPPEYQRTINALGIRGSLAITTSASVNPSDLSHSRYDTIVELKDATARLPKWDTALNRLSAKLHLSDGGGMPLAELTSLDATARAAALRVSRGTLTFDPVRRHWELDRLAGSMIAGQKAPDGTDGSLDFDLSGEGPLTSGNLSPISATLHILPRGISFQPPGWASRIGQIAETELTLKDGVISARGLRAGYGDDVWYIKQADVDLMELPKAVGIRHLEGAITFGTARAPYPKPIEDIVHSLNPSGPWFFGGEAKLGLGHDEKPDYQIRVHTARGGLKLKDGKVPIYDISTALNITPAAAQILQFEAGALRGELKLAGSIGLGATPHYVLKAQVRGADLNELARALAKPGEKPSQLGGRGDLLLHMQGSFLPDNRAALASISGDGELEVRNGDFWQIPVMRSIADNSNVRTVMTVGEAAAVFTIGQGAVHLKHVAVSAPALGVEGHGSVDFAGGLNLDCITTVMGNWGEKFAVGDDVSRTVDQIQQKLNGVTQAAVVNLHVSGSVNHPGVQAVPVPILSRAMADFGNFLKSNSQGAAGLLGYVRNRAAPASGK